MTTPTLALLFEREGLPHFSLPEELAQAYGGGLGFARPCLFANFVSSVDGVVALRTREESGHLISGDSDADRLVMALLRACADAVLIGAGTFRHAPGHLWNADAIFPPFTPQFADLRKRLSLPPHPPLILVTATGNIDPRQPALEDAWVITTTEGKTRLVGRVPAQTRLVVLAPGPISLGTLRAFLDAEGLARVLTEGGPTLVGGLAAESLLDELFITTSPRLFGRAVADGKKSLLESVDLAGAPLELQSARRHDSHLFLRYQPPRRRVAVGRWSAYAAAARSCSTVRPMSRAIFRRRLGAMSRAP